MLTLLWLWLVCINNSVFSLATQLNEASTLPGYVKSQRERTIRYDKSQLSKTEKVGKMEIVPY
jgi:hypothetical protein